MRISTSQIFQMSLSSMLNNQAELSRTQLQLSTGKQNLTPSDDPSATAQVLKLDELIATNDQYQRNADFADARLKHEEAVLTEAVNIVQRVRELAVYANNDTLTSSDRKAIAIEVRNSLDAMVQLANTRDSDGGYLFSGFSSDTQAFTDNGSGIFTYQGDQGQRALDIGSSRQVTIGNHGDEVFMKVDDGAGGTISIFDALYTFATDLEVDAPQQVTLTQLDSALRSISDTRSSIGARMNTIEMQRGANESVKLLMQENRSELHDLDYTEAVSRFERQVLALQAAQQSFAKVESLSLFNYL